MAIYTNYGRYLKAREFKEILSGENNETYMLFGIGNHLWDGESEIPIAPYNTTIITENIENTVNQFSDYNVNQYFMKSSEVIQTMLNGAPLEESAADIIKDYLPPFPCVWQNYDDNDILISQDDGAPRDIARNEYHLYYIQSNDDSYDWYKIEDGDSDSIGTSIAITEMPQAQHFSELVLRGNALKHNEFYLKNSVAPCVPVGLLGAVKCNIDFVKDIGTDEDNQYSGKSNQFFYGDRYWEIVSPDEKLTGDPSKDVLPHHLIITSTINPRNMQEVLKLDQNIVPRQIAIYTRKKKIVDGSVKDGATFYRVHQNLFNFGQYEQSDFKDVLPNECGEILNFSPAYYTTSGDDKVLHQGNIDDRFNLLLVDYIKGSARADKHAIDRFGYVIGF